MKQIPNLFTLLNLFLGTTAIIFILQTGQTIAFINNEGYTMVDLPEKITWGAILIFCAAIVDFLDGFLARLMQATSPMGKQLDSLSDVVSFGVAPALIIYQLLRISYAQEENGLDVSIAFLLPALIIACAAAWRLAKFNLDESQEYSFKGLPTPAAGLFVASLPLILHFPPNMINITDFILNKWILYLIIILLSFLMVSNLPLISFKFKDFSLKNNLPKYLIVIIGVVAAIFLQWIAVPILLVTYVIVSLLSKNKSA
ncbi:MAG TPA: CDP-diacylglycerol--serine O-phosphatidyltransferase [Chitinophagaceae bacterium]|jgi:CDP-diacylglycerol--serine O-phosphatidyltransferase|nr:CDP-diacylglycerol--serine O-phosphatidyltransferase [Chitinophagaceae bacterium]